MGQFYPDPENNRIDEKKIFYWILSHLSTEHTKFSKSLSGCNKKVTKVSLVGQFDPAIGINGMAKKDTFFFFWR